MRFRRPDIDIRPGFLNQLRGFEKRLHKKLTLTESWTDQCRSLEETVLANTLLNTTIPKPEEVPQKLSRSKIRWRDENNESLIEEGKKHVLPVKPVLKSTPIVLSSTVRFALRPNKSASNIQHKRIFSNKGRSLRQLNSRRRIFR